MKLKKLFIIAVLAAGFVSCDSDEAGSVNQQDNKPRLNIPLSSTESAAVANTNGFGLRLFESLSSGVGEQNVFFSPLISSLNLSLLANGSAGETRSEILAALGVDDSQIGDLNTAMHKIITSLPGADNMAELTLASSLWLADFCHPSAAFTGVSADSYKSAIHTYPFRSPTLAADINKWCADNTGGAIKQLVQQSQVNNSVFCILGATVFSGQWANKFSGETVDDVFYTTNQGERSVKMMNDHRDYNISTSDKVSMLKKPFGNGSFSIAFLLPHEGIALGDAIKSLDADSWSALTDVDALKLYNVTLSVPRLDITAECDLIPHYDKLGIHEALTDNADFSNITGGKGGVALQLSLQKAKFTMDEDGAKAVAAQIDAGMPIDAGPDWTEKKDFRLDRPFAFVILENSTKVIMFAGKVECP
ncbi:MAG: hypothetical protein K2M94_01355 [Paramuribaculum sp.]|nr:hypothetical protein [Paramuribaculum sp.]